MNDGEIVGATVDVTSSRVLVRAADESMMEEEMSKLARSLQGLILETGKLRKNDGHPLPPSLVRRARGNTADSVSAEGGQEGNNMAALEAKLIQLAEKVAYMMRHVLDYSKKMAGYKRKCKKLAGKVLAERERSLLSEEQYLKEVRRLKKKNLHFAHQHEQRMGDLEAEFQSILEQETAKHTKQVSTLEDRIKDLEHELKAVQREKETSGGIGVSMEDDKISGSKPSSPSKRVGQTSRLSKEQLGELLKAEMLRSSRMEKAYRRLESDSKRVDKEREKVINELVSRLEVVRDVNRQKRQNLREEVSSLRNQVTSLKTSFASLQTTEETRRKEIEEVYSRQIAALQRRLKEQTTTIRQLEKHRDISSWKYRQGHGSPTATSPLKSQPHRSYRSGRGRVEEEEVEEDEEEEEEEEEEVDSEREVYSSRKTNPKRDTSFKYKRSGRDQDADDEVSRSSAVLVDSSSEDENPLAQYSLPPTSVFSDRSPPRFGPYGRSPSPVREPQPSDIYAWNQSPVRPSGTQRQSLEHPRADVVERVDEKKRRDYQDDLSPTKTTRRAPRSQVEKRDKLEKLNEIEKSLQDMAEFGQSLRTSLASQQAITANLIASSSHPTTNPQRQPVSSISTTDAEPVIVDEEASDNNHLAPIPGLGAFFDDAEMSISTERHEEAPDEAEEDMFQDDDEAKDSGEAVEEDVPVPTRPTSELVMDELLSSENVYVSGLRAVFQSFREPLVSGNRISEEEDKALFSSLQLVLNLHEEILESMQSRPFALPAVLLDHAPFLKVYTDYICGFDVSLQILATFRSAEKSRSAVKKVLDQGFQQVGKDIASLLITPIQRLPRYELLLKEFLSQSQKETEEDPFVEDDKRELIHSAEQALKAIQHITSEVNERKRDVENMHELHKVQEALVDSDTNVVEPHRRVVKRGTLTCVSFTPKESGAEVGDSKELQVPADVTLFLCTDVLFWVDPSSTSLCRLWPLTETTADVSDTNGEIYLIHDPSGERVAFAPSSRQDGQSWESALLNLLS